jgi:sugar lactone lactonase YvrE
MKSMSVLLGAILLMSATSLNAQTKLEKVWSSDTLLKVPESVLYSKEGSVLYIANIDGGPAEKDGKGSIGKLGLDGKIIQAEWVTGLNAPKGMAITGSSLWVADVDRLVEIDIKAGSIKRTVPIEGSEFLNDVTATPDGNIFVSDSKGKKVYQVTNGSPALYLENLKGPNGLLYHNGNLYVLDNGSLLKVGNNKQLQTIAQGMDGSTDGIEPVKGNDFIVSCWTGVIYYVHADGKTEQLLDTREQKVNSADIGYDQANRIVYVPTFFKNNVVAYKLNVK